MTQERFVVQQNASKLAEESRLIISVVEAYSNHAKIAIGRPGLPNADADLKVGGALLFETPEGLFEVRVLSLNGTAVEVLVTEVAPTRGILAGFVDQDISNSRFSSDELRQIAASIAKIRAALARRADFSPQQLEFISRKLDEMQASSERLGRKDWINLALGTLTSIVFTAALESTAAKALFDVTGEALSWLFGTGMRFLP